VIKRIAAILIETSPSKTDLNQPFMLLSNRLELSGLGNLIVVMTLGALVLLGVPNVTVLDDIAAYANLHLILESVAFGVLLLVVVLCLAFSRRATNARLIVLGAGFACVAVLDVAHTLSYAGMPDWVTPSGPEKAINFWLAARFTGAITLILVSYQSSARFSALQGLLAYLSAAALSLLLLWIGLYHADLVPRTFIDGQGLTVFKVTAEIVIALLYLFACFRFFLLNRTPGLVNELDLRFLIAAAWIFALAESFFCLYVEVTDVMNMAGHIYKIAGTLLLALALRPVLFRHRTRS
jgi:hypothetical protein